MNQPDFDWSARTKLGQGSFGCVFKVFQKSRGQHIAVKQMAKSNFDSGTLKFLVDEIKIQKQLVHPHIVQLINTFEDAENVYILIELCDGSLRDYLEQHNYRLGEEKATAIFKDIMLGVQFMVEKNYIHRDVKPENNLFTKDCFKVSDFGFATKVDMEGRAKLQDMCGTPLYMAPQILMQQPYTAKCDIWSWGILLYEMVFGSTPWPCRDERTYIKAVRSPLKFPYQMPVSENLRDLLQRCLTFDEGKRIGWKEFFSHPFFTGKAAPPAKHEQISPDILAVLRRFSTKLSNSGFKLEDIFKQFYEKFGRKELDQKSFNAFVGKIDPQLTTVEKTQLFKAFDADKSGSVDVGEINKLLDKYSFRQDGGVAARILNDIKLLIKNNGIDLRKLFSKIDRDHSGTLSKDEFFQFMKFIANKLRKYDADAVYDLIDKSHDGKVSIDEFVFALGTGTTSERQSPAVDSRHQNDACRKNLGALKRIIQRYNIPIDMLIQQFQMSGIGLNLMCFNGLLLALVPQLSQSEIKELFDYISKGDGNISVKDMKQALSKA